MAQTPATETVTIATLRLTYKAWNRTIERTFPNQYAAERYARAMMRQYRTDTRIRKQYSPQTITLRHRDSGDCAVITLQEWQQ